MFTVKTKCVRWNFACAKCFFNLSAETTVNVHNARPRLKSWILFWRTKKSFFFWIVAKNVFFMKRYKGHLKILSEIFFVRESIFHPESVSISIYGKQTRKVVTFVFKAKLPATLWTLFSRTKNRQSCCFDLMVHIVLSKRRVFNTKMKNHLLFWKNFSANHSQPQPNLYRKLQKSFHLWHNRVGSPLVDTVNQKFISIPLSNTWVYSKATSWF